MKDKNIHAGHRQRVYESYLVSGLSGFSDVEIIELLLFFAYPRQDTNVLAHRLLDTFGSLSTVFEASCEQLLSVPGITARAAVLLQLQPKIWQRYEVTRSKMTEVFHSTQACGDYLLSYFHGTREEEVWLLCLDAKCKLLSCRKVCSGSVNSAIVPIRKILEISLAVNASSVVLAHNHPSGLAVPSKEDLQTTRQVLNVLSSVDITLLDHIIVADNDFVSLRDSHLL